MEKYKNVEAALKNINIKKGGKSMANISSENGTMTLEGNWTQKVVDAFIPVAKAWTFYGV